MFTREVDEDHTRAVRSMDLFLPPSMLSPPNMTTTTPYDHPAEEADGARM